MKTICMIQARIGSSRLPEKVLSKIKDKTILEHMVDFLRHSKLTDKIVIATTILPQDDAIEDLAKRIGVDYFRGSSEDSLGRFFECAKLFKPDIIVRITGDNPLIDPKLVDKVIEACISNKSDYASNMIHRTYPLGYLAEAMTFSTLESLHKTQKDSKSREHITWHIRQNPRLYRISEVFAPENMIAPDWKLDVDYEEDLELIKEIFNKLYRPDSYIPYEKVYKLINENKKMLDINKQKSLD